MCELLVRYKLRDGEPKRFAQGDVLVVMPDGHPWTVLDIGDGDRKVIKLPGVDPESVRQYTHAVSDYQGKRIRRRGRALNVVSGDLAELLAMSHEVTLEKSEHSTFNKASIIRPNK